MRASARHLLGRGHPVLRLNLRGAGPSRPRCRLQYHAYPAAAGWLVLYDQTADSEARLVCLVEAIGNMAWDCLREPGYPFSDEILPYDELAFITALEVQDEHKAVALLRGALSAGRHFAELERALTVAALRHYADFGHSLIYVLHTGRLIDRLGQRVEAPLLLALVRSLVNARREDLIPEFRGYAKVLPTWWRRRISTKACGRR